MKSSQIIAPGTKDSLKKPGRKHRELVSAAPAGRFPRIEEQLKRITMYLLEMEERAAESKAKFQSEFVAGTWVTHKQHPEYGIGIVRSLTHTGVSAYCRFDQYSCADPDWTPSGFYPVNQLEIVRKPETI